MGLLLPLLSSSLVFLVIVVGAKHEVLDPVAYWHQILPHTTIPTAIAKHLPNVHADDKTATTVDVGKGGVGVHTGKGTTVNVGKGGVGVHTGKGTTVIVGKGGVGVATPNSKPGKGTTVNIGKGGVGVATGKGTTVGVGKGGVGVATNPKGKPVVVHVNPVGSPFDYNYAASDTQLNSDPTTALFFLPSDLRPGKHFVLQLAAETNAVPATFIPRRTADAVPFSTSHLPSILSRLNIPSNSGEAEAVKSTLAECEAAPAAGEKKLCATSLESMVEFATANLASRDVVAVGTEGGGGGTGKRRLYEVRAVRRAGAGGGKGVVACHPEAYPYAVFLCHASTTSKVYEVEMRKEGGVSVGVKAVAVCHTNTAGWNPRHVAFRALKVRPGEGAVCHFLPRDHVVWAGRCSRIGSS